MCTEILRKEPENGATFKGYIQLYINTALKQVRIRHTVSAARNLVGHFKNSTKATAALKEKQKKHNVVENNLIWDVATRWISTCEMLDRLVEHLLKINVHNYYRNL